MKRTLLALVLIALCLCYTACRGWPEMNQDVTQFRNILTVYREGTTAKNVTETAKYDALGQKLDSIAGKMQDLTK